MKTKQKINKPPAEHQGPKLHPLKIICSPQKSRESIPLKAHSVPFYTQQNTVTSKSLLHIIQAISKQLHDYFIPFSCSTDNCLSKIT